MEAPPAKRMRSTVEAKKAGYAMSAKDGGGLSSNDVALRYFDTFHHTGSVVEWRANVSGAATAQYVDGSGDGMVCNNTPLEFVFQAGETRYISGRGSYITFDLARGWDEPVGRLVGNTAQLDQGVQSLFREIELRSKDGQVIDRNQDPGLVRGIRDITGVSTSSATRGARSMATGSGNYANPLFRTYVVSLSDLLGVFDTDDLLLPHFLEGCTLMLYPAKTFESAITVVHRHESTRAPVFPTSSAMITNYRVRDRTYQRPQTALTTYASTGVTGTAVANSELFMHTTQNVLPELLVGVNAPSGTSGRPSPLLNEDIKVSLQQARMVLDVHQIDRMAHEDITNRWLTGGIVLQFSAWDLFNRTTDVSTGAYYGGVTDWALPRAYGAVSRVTVKAQHVGLPQKFQHYESRVDRRFDVTKDGAGYFPLPVEHYPENWAFKSVQLVHGNVLHPRQPLTTPTEAYWQFLHATNQLHPHTVTLNGVAGEFVGYDLATFKVGNDLRAGMLDVRGHAPSAEDAPGDVSFDRSITARIAMTPYMHKSTTNESFVGKRVLTMLVEYSRKLSAGVNGTVVLV